LYGGVGALGDGARSLSSSVDSTPISVKGEMPPGWVCTIHLDTEFYHTLNNLQEIFIS
jgi:hypothetical protein